jgi:pyruvyl transferase EpsI
LAADFPNLGDVAITKAVLEWVSRFLPDHRPVILPAGRVIHDLRGLSRACGGEDLLCLVGGGNLGDLYPRREDARRRCIRAFIRMRAVSFPQSVCFSATAEGRAEAQRSRRTYLSHPRLIMTARDAESLDRIKALFPGLGARLVPDQVLGMKVPSVESRNGPPLLCVREDKESRLLPKQRLAIKETLTREFADLDLFSTTSVTRRGSYDAYLPDLHELLIRIARAPLVVTDRLHGVIFCVITGTPCVALDNSYGKIGALHRTWLRDCGFVVMARSAAPEDVLGTARKLAGRLGHRPDFSAEFAALASAVRGM